MATIYSNRNDNAGAHSTVSALSTSTWSGGVVPVAADLVYIIGRRTTINQSSFSKWAGTRTITVASTTGFASTGFFYTLTDQEHIVKVNYTGTTSTTFTGCSVDETDSFYSWTNDGSTSSIPNGAYVHNPAYIVEVGAGQTFECNELIIQEGGWLLVNGGTVKVNQGLLVRDGRLIGSSTGTIIVSRPAGTTTSSTIGYLNAENYQLSVIDIDGGENRVYAELSSAISKGDGSLTVSNVTNGSFAVGDEIAVYEMNNYRLRNKGYTGYRDASSNFKDMDEGFDIVGVNSNTIYLGKRNGSRGTVKSVETSGGQKIVEVLPESIYFNAGDKVVIENNVYTVSAVQNSEFLYATYDFTNSNTSLSDFWVNDSTHVYSSGWTIEDGIGLRNTAGAYRELIHKTLWTREVIVEAEMSPLSAYSSGTRTTQAFGIITSYDPAYRWGHRGYDSFKSDFFAISEVDQDVVFYIRAMSNYVNNRPDRDAELQTIIRQPALYRVENRKGLTKAYINNREFTTEYRRDGAFKGLVGIYTNSNSNFRCKSLTIKLPTQKLYITTANTINVDAKVYESGSDHQHPIGSRVVKIASINNGTGSHRDLAFAYIGQDGSGTWPLIIQRNGSNTTDSDFPYVHNHDQNFDYYENLGETSNEVSLTIDLLSQKTFTHVSFVPRVVDNGGFFGYNGVAIYGSNDLSNWTTLYGPTNDTKKWYGGGGSYGRMAYYPTGTVSYRYVKFGTKGDQSGSLRNRYVNIGVHNFSEGYSIGLNNASDFNVGDKILVMVDSGYQRVSREYEAYQARILSNTNPEEYMHGGWLTECTITSKDGNKIFLDKPVWWGYIENADSVTVVKTNKNFVITGTMPQDNSFGNWRWPNISINDGSNIGRIHFFKNVRFDYIGSYRYSGSSSFNRGVLIFNDNYWNKTVFDSCSSMTGSDGTTYSGNFNLYYTSGIILRNSVVSGAYTGIYNAYDSSSYSGFAILNNKFFNHIHSFYFNRPENFVVNYNELASADYSVLGSTRVDRMAVPFFNEIRFNYWKGSSYTSIINGDETEGPRRMAKIRIEDNKVRAMDDYAIISQTFDGWPYVRSNFMAEHTGSRISRYRNEGYLNEGDTSSDLTWGPKLTNVGKFGYDIVNGVYYKLYLEPSNDYLRFFSVQGDALFWILGIELEVEDDVDFQVYVKFDYRLPWVAKIQDDGTDDGRLRVYSIQHATTKSTQYGIAPTSLTTNWNTFEYTFNNFEAENGKAGVFISRSAQNGYIDIKNSTAYILTDNPDKIKVIGNTFELKNITDQYGERKYMKPLTAPTSAVKVKRLKF